MAFVLVDLDTVQPNGKPGDPARAAFTKINSNFADVQTQLNAVSSTASGAATSQQLSSEVSARQGADTVLKQNIDSEISARQGADTVLQQNINAVSSVASAALPKAGGAIAGALSVGDALSVGGFVSSSAGYKTKAGSATSAAPAADVFNFSWANSQLTAWINTTSLGRVALGSDITTINNSLSSKYDKNGGTIAGPVVVNGTFATSGSVQAGSGYIVRPGISGLPGTNQFNFNWANGKINAFVDSTDLGSIAFQTSDYRLKEQVKYISSGDLDKVMRGRPCEWRFKPDVFWYDGGTLHRSFIAHELQEIDPVLAIGVKDEVYGPDNQIRAQGVDVLSITSLLWGALQEEHALLLKLQERVSSLEAQLSGS